MEEIILRMKHTLPFNNLSIAFPAASISRWCNSMVDYLEIGSEDGDVLNDIREGLPAVVSELHSELIYEALSAGRLSIMVKCRCSPLNSTARMVEEADCLWKAPVTYAGGIESITVVALEGNNFARLSAKLERIAEVEIMSRRTVVTDALRDSYTLSLSSLFQGLTKKQLSHFSRAVASGYFDVPKKSSMNRLAKSAELSESALQEHISKAESKIIYALYPYITLYLASLSAGQERIEPGDIDKVASREE
jgi:predicted DNA binding protein